MRTRTKLLLGAAAVLAAAIPAIAQDQPESLLPPGFGEQSPAPAPTPASPGNTAAPTGGSETAVEIVPMDQALADLLPENVPPPVELPASARRDPSLAGPLPSSQTGFEQDAWGKASGKFLSVLLRRTHAPLPSRWAHNRIHQRLF